MLYCRQRFDAAKFNLFDLFNWKRKKFQTRVSQGFPFVCVCVWIFISIQIFCIPVPILASYFQCLALKCDFYSPIEALHFLACFSSFSVVVFSHSPCQIRWCAAMKLCGKFFVNKLMKDKFSKMTWKLKLEWKNSVEKTISYAATWHQ